MSHPNMEKLEDCLKYYLKVKRLKIVFLIPYAWTKLLLEESFEKWQEIQRSHILIINFYNL